MLASPVVIVGKGKWVALNNNKIKNQQMNEDTNSSTYLHLKELLLEQFMQALIWFFETVLNFVAWVE